MHIQWNFLYLAARDLVTANHSKSLLWRNRRIRVKVLRGSMPKSCHFGKKQPNGRSKIDAEMMYGRLSQVVCTLGPGPL